MPFQPDIAAGEERGRGERADRKSEPKSVRTEAWFE